MDTLFSKRADGLRTRKRQRSRSPSPPTSNKSPQHDSNQADKSTYDGAGSSASTGQEQKGNNHSMETAFGIRTSQWYTTNSKSYPLAHSLNPGADFDVTRKPFNPASPDVGKSDGCKDSIS